MNPKQNKYKGMTHYELGASQGHSKKKVDSMIKRAKSSGEAMTRALQSKKKMGRDGDETGPGYKKYTHEKKYND